MQLVKQSESSAFKLSFPEQPLQNSMVQLGSNPLSFSPRKKLSLNDDNQFNQLRKSLISSTSGAQGSCKDLTQSQATFSFAFRSPVSRQGGAASGANNGASPVGRQFWSPKVVSKASNPESQINSQEQTQKANASWNLKKNSFQKSQIVRQVVKQLREEHINPMISSMRSQMIRNFSQLQKDLTDFKNETTISLRKHENSILELSLNKNISNELEKKAKSSKYDQQISEVKTQLFVFETKLAQIQSHFLSKIKSQQKQMQKLSAQLTLKSTDKIQSSPFKSSIPPVMLQYKQSFKLKINQTPKQFLISNMTYNIDQSGYLMDSQNYYLIDSKGMRIQLQDKHLQILNNFNMLNHS